MRWLNCDPEIVYNFVYKHVPLNVRHFVLQSLPVLFLLLRASVLPFAGLVFGDLLLYILSDWLHVIEASLTFVRRTIVLLVCEFDANLYLLTASIVFAAQCFSSTFCRLKIPVPSPPWELF